MFERAVSVSEVSGCPPHHNAKPQGVSVQLHFQLPTHNPASYSIGIWKNTVIMGTLCQGCSFVMFHIIHSCLCCLLKPSEKWSWKTSWLHGHFANRFKVFHRRKPSKSSNPTILWCRVRCYRTPPPTYFIWISHFLISTWDRVVLYKELQHSSVYKWVTPVGL